MDILSLGNSFSQDAQRYLHGIAKAGGASIESFNLYIGGCPLASHFRNMLSDEPLYSLEMNGKSTGFKVSLKQALLNRSWDVITIQQASRFSPNYAAYQPYGDRLAEFVRFHCPKAKLVVHQTWAYEQGSVRLHTSMGYADFHDMLADVTESYRQLAESVHADFIIPSGEVLGALTDNGIARVHRDTSHAALGVGRYALGLTWYRFLTGRDVADNPFCDFDEEIPAGDIETVKKCVAEIAEKYGR